MICGNSVGNGIIHQKSSFSPGAGGSGVAAVVNERTVLEVWGLHGCSWFPVVGPVKE